MTMTSSFRAVRSEETPKTRGRSIPQHAAVRVPPTDPDAIARKPRGVLVVVKERCAQKAHEGVVAVAIKQKRQGIRGVYGNGATL
jgi:hypothetical protein